MKRITILILSLLTMFSFLSAWRVNALPSGEKIEHIRSLRDLFMEFRRGRGVLPADLSQWENRFRNLPRTGGSFGANDSHRATQSDSLNVRMVGRWPYGPSYAVAADRERQLAFLGSGGAVLVFELSDPWNPAKIGEITTPGMVSALFYAEHILYVGDGGAGFRMISVENPALPVELGYYDTPAYAWAVAATDSFAYVIDITEYDWALLVLSISDPQHIEEEGVFPSPAETSFAWNLAVQDSLAFIATDFEGLLIVSVSNPAWIYEVGSYVTPFSSITDVAVADTLAYVTNANNGLLILSIADPSNPVLVGSSNPPETFDLAVTVSDSFAYTAGISTFRVVTIYDPENPTERGRSDSLSRALDIARVGKYAYLADSWEGMWTISTIDPTQPVVHSSCEGESWSDGVAVSDTLVSIAHGEKGLLVLSVSDPARPRKLGFCDPEGEEWVDVLALTPGYAYLTGSDFDFTAFSLLDPSSPEMLGIFPLKGDGVCLGGEYAYLAAGSNGLHIISVIDPENLSEAGSCDTPGSALDVVVSHPYAYVADWSGVGVIDILSPSSPQVIGNYSIPGTTSSVALYHEIAFAANQENGLYFLDVSDPANPLLVNYCDLDQYPPNDVDALRGLACAAVGGDGGVRIVNPSTCEEVGYYDTPGQALGIVVSDSLVYVADGEGGITILEYYGPNAIEGPEAESPPLPTAFSLSQNYPNPFNPATTISYSISETGDAHELVRLSIYSMRGRLVRQLVEDVQGAGTHAVSWNGRDGNGFEAPSGIYFVRLEAGGDVLIRKMIMTK